MMAEGTGGAMDRIDDFGEKIGGARKDLHSNGNAEGSGLDPTGEAVHLARLHTDESGDSDLFLNAGSDPDGWARFALAEWFNTLAADLESYGHKEAVQFRNIAENAAYGINDLPDLHDFESGILPKHKMDYKLSNAAGPLFRPLNFLPFFKRFKGPTQARRRQHQRLLEGRQPYNAFAMYKGIALFMRTHYRLPSAPGVLPLTRLAHYDPDRDIADLARSLPEQLDGLSLDKALLRMTALGARRLAIAEPLPVDDQLFDDPSQAGAYERILQLLDLPFLTRYEGQIERGIAIDATAQDFALRLGFRKEGVAGPSQTALSLRGLDGHVCTIDLPRFAQPYITPSSTNSPAALNAPHQPLNPWRPGTDFHQSDWAHPDHYLSGALFRRCLPVDCPMPRFGVIALEGEQPGTVRLIDTQPLQFLPKGTEEAGAKSNPVITIEKNVLKDPEAFKALLAEPPLSAFEPWTAPLRTATPRKPGQPAKTNRRNFYWTKLRTARGKAVFWHPDADEFPHSEDTFAPRPFALTFRHRKAEIPLGPIFTDSDEANAWFKAEGGHPHFRAVADAMVRNTSMRPVMPNPQRTGPDWLAGRNATASDFLETFGFRGVEFGNWVTQTERTMALNHHYNSLCDLAEFVGCELKGISLNGRLNLAIGSRGRGGKNAPKAHYEPGRKVIHLTRTRGAGSLAHEWMHALDDFAGCTEGKGHSTEGRAEAVGLLGSDASGKPRNESWDHAVNYSQRSDRLDNLTRKTPYYGLGWELLARAFEDSALRGLAEQGRLNDHLVARLSEADWRMLRGPMPANDYPYPTAAEAAAFAPALRAFTQKSLSDLGIALTTPARPEPRVEAPLPSTHIRAESLPEEAQMALGF